LDTDSWLWIGVGCLLLLVAFNAFAAAAETAVALARRNRLALNTLPAARAAERILDDADRVFRSARVVATLTKVLAPLLGLFAGALALSGAVPRAADGGERAIALPVYVITIVAAAVLVPILSELLPKAYAARRPDEFLLGAAPAITLFTRIMAPLEWLARATGRVFTSAGTAAGPPRAAHSEEEIKILVEDSAEEGVLEEQERAMIHSIFEFTDTVVRKVMVPRIDMVCLQANTPIGEAVQVVLEEGHSRIPCFEETVDSIVGIVHAKDLLRPLVEGRHEAPFREFMREPYFVPEGKKVDELLREFRRNRIQMAIVVDEYGGTSGLVTVEDLLEEIVGDIQDEYDVEEPELVPVDDHTAIVDARMNIDELNERLGLDLPTEEFDTVGGLVFGLLGHVPAAGDIVPFDSLQFVVEEVEGNRIERVRVIRAGGGPPPGDTGESPPSPAEAAGG
jgi:magnesium and cobalt exporter, CNNM family